MSIPEGFSVRIREVWAQNLHKEFLLIRKIAPSFPFLSIDTEFPGTVVSVHGQFDSPSDYNYHTLKANVNVTKLIQVGFTFTDDKGRLPSFGNGEYCVWQFNFKEFNDSSDLHAADSIELLRRCGIDFRKNREKGIDAQKFGKLLISSGLVKNEKLRYVCFHGGYDFAYLLKILSGKDMPALQKDFFALLSTYFGTIYDVKYMMKFCNNLHGGLQKLANSLKVKRFGASHQAGSDSLLTSSTFQKLKETYFNRSTEKYSGILYGLGINDDGVFSGVDNAGVYSATVHACVYSGIDNACGYSGMDNAYVYSGVENASGYSGMDNACVYSGVDARGYSDMDNAYVYSGVLYGLGMDNACVYQQLSPEIYC